MRKRFTLIVAGSLDQCTGGYLYDAQMVHALREQGFEVIVVELAGHFPQACDQAAGEFAKALDALEDGEHVIIDGLVMGSLPDMVASHGARLDITALLHHPLGDEQGLAADEQERLHVSELQGLQSVARIIVTSRFTERRLNTLADDYALPISAPITAVEPGVEPAPISPGHVEGEPVRLLCVATLTPRKGQDVLVEALSHVRAPHWQCDLFGGKRDPAFTAKIEALIERHRLTRITLHGECDTDTLEAAYQHAHALVLPSWYEGYGMVVTEALAHGLPVITTTGGALADTLPDKAGLSVEPGDAKALAEALERFCSEAELRERLRLGAVEARDVLNDWQAAGAAFISALTAQPELSAGSQFAADWLTLRESVDFKARSATLAQQAGQWLEQHPGAPEIADLGCGRGSSMQFLAPRIRGAQTWRLFDHDTRLLEDAQARARTLESASGDAVKVRTHCASLTDLTHEALSEAKLVTASALLDLVSREWIDMLASRCAAQKQALLVALSVTGQWCFVDQANQVLEDEDDRWALALFNAHQLRDKGLGQALGGTAHGELVEALKGHGYRVDEAETPWQLGADDQTLMPMMCSLVEGWAEAMTEQAPQEANRIAQWRDARLDAVRAGKRGIWVGHRDLLALPPVEA
ncbi:glycosyltransferase [Vreelandella sp. EE22]